MIEVYTTDGRQSMLLTRQQASILLVLLHELLTRAVFHDCAVYGTDVMLAFGEVYGYRYL